MVKYLVYSGDDVVFKYAVAGITSGGSNDSWMCGRVKFMS